MAVRSGVADTVYRMLLRLYPVRFQEEFGPDMALDFADASDEAWGRRGWRGLTAVWAHAAADVAGSLAVQWMRTGAPRIAAIAFTSAAATASVVVASALTAVVPDRPLLAHVAPRDRDLVILMLLTACVLLIVAATIIFSLWFLRPLVHRRTRSARITLTLL